jgi:hypothetical protein
MTTTVERAEPWIQKQIVGRKSFYLWSSQKYTKKKVRPGGFYTVLTKGNKFRKNYKTKDKLCFQACQIVGRKRD